MDALFYFWPLTLILAYMLGRYGREVIVIHRTVYLIPRASRMADVAGRN